MAVDPMRSWILLEQLEKDESPTFSGDLKRDERASS